MGCAITPQPIFGSDMKAGQTAPGAAWGTSYGPSHAHIVGSDGAVHEISGNGDSVLGEAPVHPGLIMPLAGVVRASVAPRLDLGAHIGGYGAGGGARVRLTDPEALHAVFLTGDAQVGYALVHDDRTSKLGTPYVGRVLMETAWSAGRRWQVLGAVGLSAGYRRHGVNAGSFMESETIDRIIGAENDFAVERSELRLEGGLGCYLGLPHFGVQAMLMPYVVVAHGAPSAECLNCTDTANLEAFSQHWGLTVVVNPFGLVGPSE
jgi:hypothetical protein